MKIFKVINLVLVIILVGVLAASCSNKTTTTTITKTMTADVKTGTISLSVTGTGNLVYANEDNLSFAVAGSVTEVPVNVGDTVKKGAEIASMDTSDTSTWATQVNTLSNALTTAQRNETTQENNLVTAQRNVTSKQDALTAAQRQVSTKQLAVTQAQLDLQTAQDALAAISVKLPLTVDQDQLAVANAQIALKIAQDNYDKAQAKYESNYTVPDYVLAYAQAQAQLQVAQDNLTSAQSTLAADQAGPDPSLVSQAQLKISQSQQALDDAKFALVDANTAVTDAQQNIDDAEAAVGDAQQNINDAKQAVQDAQTALDEEKNLSSVISAPFDCVITKISVAVGDIVQKGSAAVQIADPTQYEANIMVTENDIFSVKVGEAATLSLDALTGISYPAEITAISPTATVSQGVVNYSVTVKLTSLQPISAAQSSSGQTAALPASGAPSSGITSTTTASGVPPVVTTSATSVQRGGGTRPSTNGTVPSVVTRNSNLKDGLSATVDIITQEAANVLVIPSRAITKNGVSYSVRVVNGTTTTTKFVTIGMTDGTNTEIKSGISAGDQVSYTVTSTSSTSSAKKTTTTNIQQIIRGGGGAPVPGGF